MNMKEWERKKQQEIHNSRLKNAKTTISNQSRISNLNTTVSTSQTPSHKIPLFKSIEEIDITKTSVFKLLQIYKLQQYAKKFVESGYGENLYLLNDLSEEDKESFITFLKVIPGHKEKFNLFFQAVSDIFPSGSTVTNILSQISIESKGVPIKPMTSYPKVRTINKQSPSKTQIIFKAHQKIPRPNSPKGKKIQKEFPPPNKATGQNIINKEKIVKTNNYVTLEKAFDNLGVGYFLSLENETTKEIDQLISQMNLKEIQETSKSSLDQDKFLKEIDELIPRKNSPLKLEKKVPENIIDLPAKEEALNLRLSISTNSNKSSKSPIDGNKKVSNIECNAKLEKNVFKSEASNQLTSKEETKELQKEIVIDYPEDFEKDDSLKNSDLVIMCNESKIEKSNISFSQNNNNSESPELNNKKQEEIISRYGYSMDFTKAGGGIGDLDLKLMCKCLSYAIKRHISFSKGCSLIQELGEKIFKYQDNKMLDFTIHNEEDKIEKNEKKDLEDAKEIDNSIKKGIDNRLKDLFEESFEFSINKKEFDDKTINKNIESELSYTESQLEEFFKNNICQSNVNKVQNLLEKNKQSLRNYYKNQNNKSQNERIMIVSSYNDLIKILNNNSNNFRKSYETEAKGNFDNSNLLCNPNFELRKNNEGNESKYSLESHLIEQKYSVLDENYVEYIKNKIVIFNENYDFDIDSFIPVKDIPEPDQKEISQFCKCIIRICKMEKEIPIICLIYIEKLMSKTGILINSLNWRRFTFITLILASKIWDDESFENIHFHKVFPKISLKEINELERIFLTLIDYDVQVKGAEYAKYYFILRSLSEKAGIKFPLKPITVEEIIKFKKCMEKAQNILNQSAFQ